MRLKSKETLGVDSIGHSCRMKLKCGHDLSKATPTPSLQCNNTNSVMCFRDHQEANIAPIHM
jgi:hypothetical protein